MENILTKTKRRSARRNRHQDIIATNHVCHLTGLLYIILGTQLQMMTQTIIRLTLVLVKRIYKSRIVFGTQILQTKCGMSAEEKLIMQLGCGSTAYTQTYTFQHVPTHKIVYRTKVKLTQVYISCWSGCHKLRRNRIHRRYGTRQLRHGSHFLHQLIYRILILGQGLWTKRVPCCSTIVHRH